jgi:precorrin-6B methylase 2
MCTSGKLDIFPFACDSPRLEFYQPKQEIHMNASRVCRRFFFALFLLPLSAGAAAQAQPAKQEFKPEVGQEGKDVIWVPTPQELVEKMLDIAKVTPQDYVIDLGSGDGRTVITAAKHGAKALGIEYNPDMVELSKRNAAKEGVSDKATFMKADLFEADLSQAQVITMFLLPDINLKLRPKLLNLKPGTRVVSNSFTMGEWQADETASVKNGCASYCTAYLWIVPAKVDGTWHLSQGELTLKQTFQMVSGTLKTGNKAVPLNGRITGDQIRFTAGGTEYQGRISVNTIEGNSKSGGGFKATRAGK